MGLISILNDWGSVQIDDEFKNYCVVGKGSLWFEEPAAFAYGSINYQGIQPIVAIAPQAGAIGRFVGAPSQDYGNFGQPVYTLNVVASAPPIALDYWIFDYVPDVVDNRGHVQLWDGAGRLTFDSNLQFFKLIDFMTGTGRTRPYVPGTREAAVLCTPNMSQDGFSGGYSRSVGGVYLRDDGALDVTKFTTEYHDTSDNGNNNDLQPTYSYPDAVMIADVTGY